MKSSEKSSEGGWNIIKNVYNKIKKNKQMKQEFICTISQSCEKEKLTGKEVSQKSGISYKSIQKVRRNSHKILKKLRKGAITNVNQQAIARFYERPDVSICLPNKKLVSKKTGKPRYILCKTITATHQLFLAQHPNIKISLAKFAYLKPKHVRSQREARLHQCLCIYCTNVDLKLSEVRKINGSPNLRNHFDAVNATMCPKIGDSTYHDIKCIDRKCADCPSLTIPEEVEQNERILQWKKWERSTFPDGVKRMALLVQSGSAKDMVNELNEEMQTLSSHLFQASWQQKQLSIISQNPPPDTIVTIMDFSENYACKSQSEVQSAHWFQANVTIFPVIVYYRKPNSEEVIKEAIDFITDDRKHDSHAVNHFSGIVRDHLKEVRKVKIKKEIQFTDGCSSQFKSKIPVADLSYCQHDFGFPVERHYFETGHGKSVSDGEGGVIKSYVSKAVKSRGVIVQNAEDFYDVASSGLTKSDDSFLRSFYLVRPSHILRTRPTRVPNQSIVGIRKIHCVAGGEVGVVKTRRLSCICTSCTDGGVCSNLNYVGPWKSVVLSFSDLEGIFQEKNSFIHLGFDLF